MTIMHSASMSMLTGSSLNHTSEMVDGPSKVATPLNEGDWLSDKLFRFKEALSP